MKGKEGDFVSPVIGLVIMLISIVSSFSVSTDDLPRFYLPFSLGAVLFISAYIGNSLKSQKK